MTHLLMLCVLVIMFMIYGIGHWLWIERQHRIEFEAEATFDRQMIREVAENAASEAASCADVIKRIEAPHTVPRRLRPVRDAKRGSSTWKLE